jgi:hypothetical protein
MMNTGICASSIAREENASDLPLVPERGLFWNRGWPISASTAIPSPSLTATSDAVTVRAA